MDADSTSKEAPDSWAKRVEEALGGQFKPQMSHAVILLAIFEANRIFAKIQHSWPFSRQIRPYQRKIAILSTALDLIYTLHLSDSEKAHIISLTPRNNKENGSKPVIARMAFHRAQGLEEEVKNKILGGVEKVLEGGEKCHQDVCKEFVQNLFEEVSGKSGPHPPLWVFRRRPIFLVYRVYYRGMQLDPELFEAQVPRKVDVPRTKPVDLVAYVFGTWSPMNAAEEENEAEDGVIDPVSLDTDDADVMNATNDSKIKLGKEDEVILMPKDANGDDFVGDVVMKSDDLSRDENGKTNETKLAPVLQKYRLMHQNQRLQHLMELRVRLDLLNEAWASGASEDGFVKSEKIKIFIALPHLPANAIKDRRLLMMETRLHLEILKDLKSSGVNPGKCTKMMKDMYLGLPPLMSVEDLEVVFCAKKATRFAKREERKKKAAGCLLPEERKEKSLETDQVDAAGGDESTVERIPEGDWEVVVAVEEVNASVAKIDMSA